MKHARTRQLGELPKGLSSGTLEHLLEVLKGREIPMAAEDIAREAGIARVTARRYLEYLVGAGKVSLQREYQEVGRPKNLYRLQ
jgi:two-component system response regulator DctR